MQLSVKWLISVMLNDRNVSGKKVSKVPGVVNQVTKRGEVQFHAFKVQFSETIFVPKNQANWLNIDQVTTLCAKRHS